MGIEEEFQRLGVEVSTTGHHSRPGWIQLRDCPFCGSSSYHLGYSIQQHYFNCWKCRYHPFVETLNKLGMSFREAADLRADLSGELPDRKLVERIRTTLREPPGRGPLLEPHKNYLLGRGFEPERIERLWNVRGIGIASRLAWRLYIPIAHRGRTVSWTTRAIGTRVEQRYISAAAEEEAMNHKELVYGLEYCHHSIVIVEGPTDAWAVGPGAGALFGLAYTTPQLKILASIPYRYVCFDNSPDAQRRATELAQTLSVFDGVTENILLDAEDPGSASKQELKLLRKVSKLS